MCGGTRGVREKRVAAAAAAATRAYSHSYRPRSRTPAVDERQDPDRSAGAGRDLDRHDDQLEPDGRQHRTVERDVLQVVQVGLGQHAVRVESRGAARVHAGPVHAHAHRLARVGDPPGRALGQSREPASRRVARILSWGGGFIFCW